MSRRSREKFKGRKESGRFMALPEFVTDSPQWAALAPYSLKLLLEIARLYRGHNNGDLSVTPSTLRERGFASEQTFWKHLALLEEGGWIVRTRQGGRHIGCNLYAVTWWPIDESEKHTHPAQHKPSHAWKNAIGTLKTGVRRHQKMECKRLRLQKLERKPVPLRPVA
ncbi:hypothetical protein [Luteimonas sp. e5]